MSSVPQNLENVSLSLSEVLNDIGVNDVMVSKRRDCALFRESVRNTCSIMYKTNMEAYLFGSQSEGSTVSGLYSDDDWLISVPNLLHAIHNFADWKPDVMNLLMVQDETTAPGYCLLQCLRNDAPHAANCCPNNNYCMDAKRRVILKNTMCESIFAADGIGRNGPAVLHSLSLEGVLDADIVFALRCERWPVEARPWLNRRNVGGWPSAQLKSESANSGCFLVPIGSKLSGINQLEWRISTSLAERYLMFSLNTAHLKCYVLMKLLMKSYRVFHDVISSYMCKTALFHCIEITSSEFWQDRNLLLCLNEILGVLYNFIYFKNCPHFIIPEINLMAERISDEQQHNLLEVIQDIISSNGRKLFDIHTNNVGKRLLMKLNRIPVNACNILTPVEVQKDVSVIIYQGAATTVVNEINAQLIDDNNNNNEDTLRKLLCYYIRGYQNYPHYNDLEQKAHSCVVPLLCSTIGSLIASYNTALNRPLSDNALSWLNLGLGSDVSSGLLKLATVYYSVGDIDLAEARLRQVDQQYDKKNVMPACGCCAKHWRNREFNIEADLMQITDFRRIVSYCVMFMHREINIVPAELRHEYCRSTPEDIQCRDKLNDGWMNLAVVDSLPYLYFLQYKTYGRLENHGEQQVALHKLKKVILDEPNLNHKETALNLLGQCMEQENLPNDALDCYERSLQFLPRNNAANFHMSRLLAK